MTEVADLRSALDFLTLSKTRLLDAGEPALAMLVSSIIAKARFAEAQAERKVVV
jgi:hypothetical protein